MAEKQKKIVVDFPHSVKREVVLPEGAYIQFIGEYTVAYPSSWKTDTPIFQMKIPEASGPVIINIVDVSVDDALVERIKGMTESEFSTLRNIMESAGLLN